MSYDEYLPAGLTLDDLILLCAGATAFLGIFALWLPLMERAPSTRRVQALKQRRDILFQDAVTPEKRGLAEKGMGFASRTVKRLKLMRGQTADQAQEKLLRAGYRSRDAIIVYLFFKLALPLGLAAVAAILFYGLNLYDLPPMGRLLAALGAVLVGFYAPDLFIKNKADKRQEQLRKGLPDALDLLVICAEAGLNLDAGLKRVAGELRMPAPELADELELTSIELGFLSDRREALNNLEKRTGLPSVGALVSTLAQAEKYGTPLAQSLRVLAAEMRDERLMKAEEKAARLPATLTVPMVLFIMPALFIVLIGPGILSTLDALSNM